MRLLIALVIVIAIAGFLGWITFKDSNNATVIQVDKQKVKDDTRKAVENTKDAVNRTIEKGREEIEKIKK